MQELEYPFDSEFILKKSKKLKKQLLESRTDFLTKKIAVLGGSTTHDIIRVLELFLLDQGIRPQFYESEYAQYWQDVMFDNPELVAFAPDLIYIHTSNRNVTSYPAVTEQAEQIDALLEEQYEHFRALWEKIADKYHCPVIQNNFEYPFYRVFGNQEAVYVQGRISFLNRLSTRENTQVSIFTISTIRRRRMDWTSGRIPFTGICISMLCVCRPFRRSPTVCPISSRRSLARIRNLWYWIWTIRSGAVSWGMTA